MSFQPSYGTHVTGERFWPGARPRPEVIVDRLASGTSVKIFGLRRIGKSSLLAEAKNQLREKGRTVLWLDLQRHSDLSGVLLQIATESSANSGPLQKALTWLTGTSSIPPDIKARLKSILEHQAGRLEGDDDDYAQALVEQLGHAFAALPKADRPILIIDELPLLVQNALDKAKLGDPNASAALAVARLNRFLALLRNWRSEEMGIAMAFSGSVSMEWLKRDCGLAAEHLNDCVPIAVEELDRDEAANMLAASYAALTGSPPAHWAQESIEVLLERLPALYPGVIQVAFDVLRYTSDVSVKALEGAVGIQVEEAIEKTYYEQFDKRYRRYSQADQTLAGHLLDRLQETEGKTISYAEALTLLTKAAASNLSDSAGLLEALTDDGIVKASRARGVTFGSGLVEKWRFGS